MSTTTRRVLLVGAETDIGRTAAEALAATGAHLALVSATTAAEAAFAVQRLARKLRATSQAIDATNEAAVRVMVRQVSKELGGLDATVYCGDDSSAKEVLKTLAMKEMRRTGASVFVDAADTDDVVAAVDKQTA
jgi:NAD(P)-dependent dehydrogenase (short-subunit alcohol dehydrogenase family)